MSAQIITLVGSALIIVLSFVLQTPGRERENEVYLPFFNSPLPETCATKRFLGIECPGCGMTRSFISISAGDFARAWLFNPTGFLIYGLVAFQIPYRAYQIWRLRQGKGTYHFPYMQAVIATIAVVVMLQWAARLLGWLA